MNGSIESSKRLIKEDVSFMNAEQAYNKSLSRSILEKVAKESSYFEDFIAGVDPRGVRTFRNAMSNEGNHRKHKAVGNAGGFVGGALAGGLLPAALTGAAALATRKRSPSFSKDMMIMTKGTLDAFNPRRVGRYIKALPGMSKLKSESGKVLQELDNLKKSVGDMQKRPESNIIQRIIRRKQVDPKDIDQLRNMVDPARAAGDAQDMADRVKRLWDQQERMDRLGKDLSQRYFGGVGPAEGSARALTALSTLGTAAAGGVTGALSSQAQYNAALGKKREFEDMKKDIVEKARRQGVKL